MAQSNLHIKVTMEVMQMKHRRLIPEQLAVELRRTTGVVGMSANELDAAADQVEAMGAAIGRVLYPYYAKRLPVNVTRMLQASITPRPHQKDSPVDRVMRLRKELDAALAELAECAKCHDSDCPKECPGPPNPDVRSALLGLMEAVDRTLPGATRSIALAQAYHAAQAVLAELEPQTCDPKCGPCWRPGYCDPDCPGAPRRS